MPCNEEMEQNKKIFVIGEDMADEREVYLLLLKVLSTKFGIQRVFNSPLAEASIMGVAVGMALTGLKPVIEIQFADYIWPALCR